MLELDRRLGASSGRLIQPLFPLSLVVASLWVGPWALLPAAHGLAFAVMPWVMDRMHRPEWMLFGTLVSLSCSLALAVFFTGGLDSPVIVWPVFMVVAVSTRFSRRGVISLTLIILVTNLSAVAAAEGAGLWAGVPALACLLAMGSVTASYAHVLAGAEFDHRKNARLDPLTGLLNRAALDTRVEELRQQMTHTDGSIALIMCDLDNFKLVNDLHGHSHGDVVLRDAATAMRRAARSFELIYRIGGEEFLVVLPGIDLDEAEQFAERLRTSVQDAQPGGLAVTASFGVSCGVGQSADFAALIEAADQALYAAKRAGRNAVRAGAGPDRRQGTRAELTTTDELGGGAMATDRSAR
jgi:diguanylate cyclase (GGDEF)-like protein